MKKLLIFSTLLIGLFALPARAQKVSALTNVTTLASNALFSVSTNTGGSYATRNISFGSLSNQLATGWKVDATNAAYSITLDTAAAIAFGSGNGDARKGLVLYTPDGYPPTVQFSSVESPTNWNGYRFWGAHTPFPDVTRESIVVVASQDGVHWVNPPGIPVPLYTAASIGENLVADTDLIFLTNGWLAVYFHGSHGNPPDVQSTLYCATTADKTNWNLTKVLTQTNSYFCVMSPTPADELDETITVWFHEDDPHSTNTWFVRLGGDGTNVLAAPSLCAPWPGEYPGTNYTGLVPFHLDVERVGTNYVAMRTYGHGGQEACLWSNNRSNWWGCPKQYVITENKFNDYGAVDGWGPYRSSMSFPYDDLSHCDMTISYGGTNGTEFVTNRQWRVINRKNVALPVPWAKNMSFTVIPVGSMMDVTTTNAWVGANAVLGSTATLGSPTMISNANFTVHVASGNIAVTIWKLTSSTATTVTAEYVTTTGSVACPAAGTARIPFPSSVVLLPGTYIVTLWCDNTTAKFSAKLFGAGTWQFGTGQLLYSSGSATAFRLAGLTFTRTSWGLTGLTLD